jgi:hypothetical protein
MMTLTEHHTRFVEERRMSDVDPRPPPQPPVYLPPQSTIQLAHATSDAVISGLAKSPYLLGVVVIVLVGVGAAIYFLQILITGQAFHLNHLVETSIKQQTELLALHKQEFDALLEMSNRLTTPQNPGPPGPPPVNPPQPRGPR